jgi:hypothetical protein
MENISKQEEDALGMEINELREKLAAVRILN